MDPAFITPFIASIQDVFSTMLQLPVTIKDPRIKADSATTYDVSGIIGMSGDVVGSVVLSFPEATARRVVSLFAGADMLPTNPDFADAVGELVNMISGGAKAMFKGRKVSISCPSVIVGRDHTVARQKGTPCIVIPCDTDCGELAIEIAVKAVSSAAIAA
ncbi:MAG: chemotaxis protein CheX [Phycisphaerales bacterium]|nr:chemotaxis protein CheX [Phycisphaerales bacterium]